MCIKEGRTESLNHAFSWILHLLFNSPKNTLSHEDAREALDLCGAHSLGMPWDVPEGEQRDAPVTTASRSWAPHYPLSVELCKHWEVLCWWGNTSPRSPKPIARWGLQNSG